MKQIADAMFDRPVVLGPQTAVIGIHWQNDIAGPGALSETFAASIHETGVIARTARLFEAARAQGSRVIYMNMQFDADPAKIVNTSAIFAATINTKAFILGTRGIEIIDELQPQADDIVLTHSRLGSFTGTDLLPLLIGNGISNVILTGLATNMAVEQAAREAVQLGFYTYLVEDCCATSDEAYHRASLMTMRLLCTGVVTCSDLIATA